MSILEKLGLSRKKKIAVPVIGDKSGKVQEAKDLRNQILVKIAISVFFLGMIITLYPRNIIKDLSYQLNEPWKQEDLTAPFDFSILKSEEEMDREIEEIKRLTPPVFHLSADIEDRIQVRIDSVITRIEMVLEHYAEWQINKRNNAPTVSSDSIRFRQVLNNSNLTFSGASVEFLLNQYLDLRIEEIRNPAQRRVFVLRDVKNRLDHLLTEVLRDGILDTSRESLESNEISIRNIRDRTERIVNISNVRDVDEVIEYVSFRLSRMMRDEPARIGTQLLEMVVEPNVIYNESQTKSRINEAIANISHTKGAVAAGQVIIRRGDLLDHEKMNMLKSLDAARASRASSFEIFLRYVGDFLLLLAFFLTFLTYLYLYRKPIFDNNRYFGLVFLLIGLVIGASAIISRLDNFSEFIVPLAIAPILLTIFFDSRVGIMAALCIALIAGQINGYSFEFFASTIVASSMGIYSVRDIRKRTQLFLTTPGLVFASYGIILLGFTLARSGAWDVLGSNMINVFVNIVLISILTYNLIYIFEKIFSLSTDLTLYELNDNNNPILKSLMLRAPGSFQHSIQVANLTEAAASSISANSLLARVGALYHDIGKMDKPHYFVENQIPGENEHDKLTPSMSAKVIKDHVKAGVKMAQEEKLPPVLIKFIETHHGNSIIKYFYEKAKKTQDEKETIQQEFFRYDGPLPDTKETGILLLADCVEAAARSVTDPSYKKLESLVDRLVDERVAEGQLKECPLTFRDLTIIKKAFLQILTAMYHGRIKYPGQEEIEAAAESEATGNGRQSKTVTEVGTGEQN
jgi:putative nucleotidyltransferase with HDIG domain